MRKIILAATLALVALTSAACNKQQLDDFQVKLSNFRTAVNSVNETIRDVSPQLLQNCKNVQGFAALLEPFATKQKYAADFNAAVAVINTYCQAPPVTDIAGTVKLTAQAAANAQAAYKAATRAGG